MFFNILVIGPCDSGKTTFIESTSKKLDKRFKINFPNLSTNTPFNLNANSENNNISNGENKFSNNQLNMKRSARKTSIGNS